MMLTSTFLTRECDLCRGRPTIIYMCERCNFDMCDACARRQGEYNGEETDQRGIEIRDNSVCDYSSDSSDSSTSESECDDDDRDQESLLDQQTSKDNDQKKDDVHEKRMYE